MLVEHPTEGPLPWAEASAAFEAMTTVEPHTDPGYYGEEFTHRIGIQMAMEPAGGNMAIASVAELETTVDESEPTTGRIELSYVEGTVDMADSSGSSPDTIVEITASQRRTGSGEFVTAVQSVDTIFVDSVVPPAIASVTTTEMMGIGVITDVTVAPAVEGFSQLDPRAELPGDAALKRSTYAASVRRAIGIPPEGASVVAITTSPLDRLRSALSDISRRTDMTGLISGGRRSGFGGGNRGGGLTFVSGPAKRG